MAVAPMRTLIVGAGITGATTARILHDARRALEFAGDVVVWEKNNIAGGRMMARSFRKDRRTHVDMGAQYLTKFTAANDDIRQLLAKEKQLAPFNDGAIAQDPSRAPSPYTEHAVSPNPLGFRAMVEHLLQDAEVHLSRSIESFEVMDEDRIKVVSSDGHQEIVNSLVLTCPTPNLLPVIEASNVKPTPEQLHAFQRVQFSQRIAVALLFDPSVAHDVRALGWTSKYVCKDEDDVVRYLCWDNLKKQPSSSDSEPFTLLVHTGVPFGSKFMDKKELNDEIMKTIVASVKKLVPFLPEPRDILLHRWRISQATTTYNEENVEEAPASIVLHTKPLVVVAGDAFLGSVFDNCLLSAKSAAKTIIEHQQKNAATKGSSL
ncbi:hypothetical protein PINS_up011208 [Pythium insidiosum]|nr:hypothetical protein PINS_up011208 [Pythium insidiosum]